ncbi:YlmH/Sll1252 family protein [Christensenellaceae bacterium OttesenSCG-928-M15]|nr:YlmH/Sll1252 family protein [Christensenellaceae bacterium OttesenSCG-928-M15]
MEDAKLQRRFLELAERAHATGRYTYTNFLNLMELDAFSRMEKSLRAIPFTLFGGADGCERKLIRFGDASSCAYEEEMPIACLKIEPRNSKFSDPLTHRDFLGSIMSLGVERETIGDIFVMDNTAHVFALKHIAPYILSELVSIRRTAVICAIVENMPVTAGAKKESEQIQLVSERLDAVVAHAYKLSRNDSLALFKSGKIFVNDRLVENSSYPVKPQDAVSVRGYGKFLYGGVVGTTRKGKLLARIEKYV